VEVLLETLGDQFVAAGGWCMAAGVRRGEMAWARRTPRRNLSPQTI